MIRLSLRPHDRVMYNASQKCASNGHWAARIVPGKVEVANEKFMARVELEKYFTLIGGKNLDLDAKTPDVEFVFGKYKSNAAEYREVARTGKATFHPHESPKERDYRIEYASEDGELSIFLSEKYSDMVESFGGVVFGKANDEAMFVVDEGEVVFAVMPTFEGERG